jgi:hypothetical protein
MRDTNLEALEIQLRVQRKMTGEQRLLLALDMSLFARDLARERIRPAHPEWDEAQVNRELLRLAFLPDLLPLRFR